MTIASKSKCSDTCLATDDTKTGCRNRVHSKFSSPFGKFHVLPQCEEVKQEEAEDGGDEESSSSESELVDDAAVSKNDIIEGKRDRRSVHFGPHLGH